MDDSVGSHTYAHAQTHATGMYWKVSKKDGHGTYAQAHTHIEDFY